MQRKNNFLLHAGIAMANILRLENELNIMLDNAIESEDKIRTKTAKQFTQSIKKILNAIYVETFREEKEDKEEIDNV